MSHSSNGNISGVTYLGAHVCADTEQTQILPYFQILGYLPDSRKKCQALCQQAARTG